MPIIILLGFVVIIAALAGVWRARARGPAAVRQSLIVLVVALVAIGLAWYVLPRR